MKRILFFIIALATFCSIHAEQVVIHVDKAGTLPTLIGTQMKNQITDLKLTGTLNGTDLKFLREMCGRDCNGQKTDGSVIMLDMAGTKIVEGGDPYYYNDETALYSENDKLGDDLFATCSQIIKIELPTSISKIGESAFRACKGLSTITIPLNVEVIGNWAFKQCEGLTNMSIPSNVTQIGKGIFYGCTNLTSVNLPENMPTIPDNMFSGCKNLSYIALPSSITSIGKSAFYQCKFTSIAIPSNVKTIGERAFYECEQLKSINIPEGVTTIQDNTFYLCKSLQSVILPNSITTIEDYAFHCCGALKSIDIPNGTTDIGSGAFEFCGYLSCVKIPATTIYIDSGSNGAFWQTHIKDLYIGSDTPKDYVSAFSDFYKSCTLHVPTGCKARYMQHGAWQQFKEIVEYDADDTQSTLGTCSTPNIFFENMKLKFTCNTEGARYIYQINAIDNKNGECDNFVDLAGTYKITVNAYKEGYNTSDAATATLYWIGAATTADHITAAKQRGIVVNVTDNTINISGLKTGEKISVYTPSGITLYNTQSAGESVSMPLNTIEKMVIVKIGSDSIKVLL